MSPCMIFTYVIMGPPRVRRNTMYSKRSKRIRSGNSGNLSLQVRLQSGLALPEQTFANFYWRGVGAMCFGTAPSNTSTGTMVEVLQNQEQDLPPTAALTANRFIADQVILMNDLYNRFPYQESSTSATGESALLSHIPYLDAWNSLYEQYQIFRSTCKLTITPPANPYIFAGLSGDANNITGRTDPTDATAYDEQRVWGSVTAARNAHCGYWYVRVRYVRQNVAVKVDPTTHALVSESAFVGHPVHPLDNRQSGGYYSATDDHWGSLRDFLSDATVSWQKDRMPKTTRVVTNVSYPTTTGIVHDSAISTSGIHTNNDGYQTEATSEYRPIIAAPQSITSMSFEQDYSTRPVNFNVTFSAKQHFALSNPMRDGRWFDFSKRMDDTDHDDWSFRFLVGYISFDASGRVAHHIPLDRLQWRNITCEMKYFVGLRKPKVFPFKADRRAPFLPPTAPTAPVDHDMDTSELAPAPIQPDVPN